MRSKKEADVEKNIANVEKGSCFMGTIFLVVLNLKFEPFLNKLSLQQNSQETKLHLASSSDTSAEGPFRFSVSEKAELKHGHKGHEEQDAPSGGKPDSIFEQVEEKRNDSETEAEDLSMIPKGL